MSNQESLDLTVVLLFYSQIWTAEWSRLVGGKNGSESGGRHMTGSPPVLESFTFLMTDVLCSALPIPANLCTISETQGKAF